VIEGPEPLAGVFMDAAARILRSGIDEGAFPADRSPPSGEVIWAGERNDPFGLATLLHDPAVGLWIDLLWVTPTVRGRGVGSALIAKAADIARERAIPGLSFGALFTNVGMTKFALKQGFSPATLIWGRKV
jgi:GNAT superfamily N-acetyltransferase